MDISEILFLMSIFFMLIAWIIVGLYLTGCLDFFEDIFYRLFKKKDLSFKSQFAKHVKEHDVFKAKKDLDSYAKCYKNDFGYFFSVHALFFDLVDENSKDPNALWEQLINLSIYNMKESNWLSYLKTSENSCVSYYMGYREMHKDDANRMGFEEFFTIMFFKTRCLKNPDEYVEKKLLCKLENDTKFLWGRVKYLYPQIKTDEELFSILNKKSNELLLEE